MSADVLTSEELRARLYKDIAVWAHNSGTSEAEIARLLGVNRLTVRRWLGKS